MARLLQHLIGSVAVFGTTVIGYAASPAPAAGLEQEIDAWKLGHVHFSAIPPK